MRETENESGERENEGKGGGERTKFTNRRRVLFGAKIEYVQPRERAAALSSYVRSPLFVPPRISPPKDIAAARRRRSRASTLAKVTSNAPLKK